MKNVLVGLLLFTIQIYLVVLGREIFSKFLNPVLLFIVSAAIPAYLIWLYLNRSSEQLSPKSPPKQFVLILWALGGLFSIALAYEELRKRFVEHIEFSKWSDVIPQVQTLYQRFSNGELPYAPINFGSYDLQPIYMPLHWLPSGLATPLNVDVRFIGYGFFALAVAVYGLYMASQPGPVINRIIALILPSLPLWAWIKWGPFDLTVAYEIVIAAYYLLLVVGLLSKKLWLITLGIILCLLSRYTLLFWLPLFALLLYFEKGIKKSLAVWGIVAASILCLFIIPFYMKDLTMLKRGFTHYMNATVGEWQGYGEPSVSWTHEHGISAAPLMKAAFDGDMATRVYWTRVIQSGIMLLAFLTSLWCYKKWRYKIDMYSFSLIALYVFMGLYYFFAPLTYRYYLFPFLIVSSVLCGNIICFKLNKIEE